MKSLEATFSVVTPCFPGGADQQRSAILAAKTVKASLQFWWRALAYSKYGADISALRAAESEIFGSSDVRIGQSKLLFSLEREIKSNLCIDQLYPAMDGRKVMLGVKYLGYGLVVPFGDRAGRLLRAGIDAPFRFTLRINSKRAIDPTVIDALKVFGLLGGVGSRSRRGFGSVSLLELKHEGQDCFAQPKDAEGLKKEIQNLVEPACNRTEKPTYSAFSALTRIEIVCEGKSALKVLNYVGEQMVRYRSWGRNERILGDSCPSEKNFEPDHHWFHDLSHADVDEEFHPRRIAFGLPQKYDNSKIVQPANQNKYGRRASPLLLHVHELAPKSYAVVMTLLASKFLPDDEKIMARKPVAQNIEDYRVLHEFFDGLKGLHGSKTTEKYFPDSIPVISDAKS